MIGNDGGRSVRRITEPSDARTSSVTRDFPRRRDAGQDDALRLLAVCHLIPPGTRVAPLAIGARVTIRPVHDAFTLGQMALEVADHVPAMLAYWNRDQVCVFANETYRAWFGRSRAGRRHMGLMGNAPRA